jgi:hypothetical protein
MKRRATIVGFFALAMIFAGTTALACGGDDDKEAAAPASPTAGAQTGDGAGASSGQLIGVRANAPPRPTPTATPVGFVAPTRVPAPEAKVVPLFMYVDTVTAGPGESKYNVDATLYCVRNSAFQRGMHIVWRMNVVDTSTGKILQTSDVKEAVLKLPHGETRNFGYGAHGGTTIDYYFWTAAWDVPPDYPLGLIDFEVVVTTNDGKTGTFKQLPVSNPASGIESRLQIIG